MDVVGLVHEYQGQGPRPPGGQFAQALNALGDNVCAVSTAIAGRVLGRVTPWPDADGDVAEVRDNGLPFLVDPFSATFPEAGR
jgi:hypothetical protein